MDIANMLYAIGRLVGGGRVTVELLEQGTPEGNFRACAYRTWPKARIDVKADWTGGTAQQFADDVVTRHDMPVCLGFGATAEVALTRLKEKLEL